MFVDFRASCAGLCRVTPTGWTPWPSAQITSCVLELLNLPPPQSTPRISLDPVRPFITLKCWFVCFIRGFLPDQNLFPVVDEIKERALERYNKVRVSASLLMWIETLCNISGFSFLLVYLLCCRAPLQSDWCLALTISPYSCGILLKTKSL